MIVGEITLDFSYKTLRHSIRIYVPKRHMELKCWRQNGFLSQWGALALGHTLVGKRLGHSTDQEPQELGRSQDSEGRIQAASRASHMDSLVPLCLCELRVTGEWEREARAKRWSCCYPRSERTALAAGASGSLCPLWCWGKHLCLFPPYSRQHGKGGSWKGTGNAFRKGQLTLCAQETMHILCRIRS